MIAKCAISTCLAAIMFLQNRTKIQIFHFKKEFSAWILRKLQVKFDHAEKQRFIYLTGSVEIASIHPKVPVSWFQVMFCERQFCYVFIVDTLYEICRWLFSQRRCRKNLTNAESQAPS